MQSSFASSLQFLEKAKFSQLNLKVKKWKLFVFIFVIIALILSTILILIIVAKNSKSIHSVQDVVKASLTCSNFQFNNTNLTQFKWNIKYNSTNQDQQLPEGQSTKVLSLNFSQTLLKQFSNNSLPDLLELKLFTSGIQSQYLETVSNNNFSKLQNLSVPNLNTFSNNYLPSLINFESEDFFYFNYFDNNYIPALNGSLNLFKPKSLTGNTMGLQDLRFNVENSRFQFYNNTLLELKSFTIFCWNYDNFILISQIMDNNFPNLQSLTLDCDVMDFKYSNKLKKLKNLYFRSSGIKQLKNNPYPQLISLKILSAPSLQNFTQNHLPKLQILDLFGTSVIDICSGNHMPSLKEVSFSYSVELKNLDCLKDSLNIQDIHLTFTSASIQNFNLPLLKHLVMRNQKKSNFSNNYFPTIETVQLQNITIQESLKKSNITFGSTLQTLQITYSNLQEIGFDIDMPNLTTIYIKGSNLTRINCISFKNAKILYFLQSKLKDDVIDTLIDCNFKNLTKMYLQSDQISDKEKARQKLYSKYSNSYMILW